MDKNVKTEQIRSVIALLEEIGTEGLESEAFDHHLDAVQSLKDCEKELLYQEYLADLKAEEAAAK